MVLLYTVLLLKLAYFFVTLDVALILALETLLSKMLLCIKSFLIQIWNLENLKTWKLKFENFLHILGDGPRFREETNFWFCIISWFLSLHAEYKVIFCWNSSLLNFFVKALHDIIPKYCSSKLRPGQIVRKKQC